jgi:hypothetical protein
MTQNITKEKEKEKTRVMMLFLCHFSLFGLERRTQKKKKKKKKRRKKAGDPRQRLRSWIFFFLFFPL